MKQCKNCKQIKPLSDFYKHSKTFDGVGVKCKDCVKQSMSALYNQKKENPEFIESERKRGREKFHRLYAGTPAGKTKTNTYRDKFKSNYPEKVNAVHALYALSKNKPGIEYHHWSYNDEHFLDVLKLPMRHHKKVHRFLIYDQERKMYRRYDTMELLDTKERHESFIRHCIETKDD